MSLPPSYHSQAGDNASIRSLPPSYHSQVDSNSSTISLPTYSQIGSSPPLYSTLPPPAPSLNPPQNFMFPGVPPPFYPPPFHPLPVQLMPQASLPPNFQSMPQMLPPPPMQLIPQASLPNYQSIPQMLPPPPVQLIPQAGVTNFQPIPQIPVQGIQFPGAPFPLTLQPFRFHGAPGVVLEPARRPLAPPIPVGAPLPFGPQGPTVPLMPWPMQPGPPGWLPWQV